MFFLEQTGKKFAVEIDEKEVAIREALPGNNCGGCGYPGCDGLAAAIAKGEAPVNRCPVGGEPVGKIIAGIMGQAAVETARQVAHVKCSGTCEKRKKSIFTLEWKTARCFLSCQMAVQSPVHMAVVALEAA